MREKHLLALPPGTKIQNYRIDSVLGQGGFGITYLAHDEALNLKVAIKEYLPGSLAVRDNKTDMVHVQSSSMDEVFKWGLSRFLDEARTLAALSHPHIVRVMNFIPLNGTGYIIMEYEDGETLGDRLDQGHHVPVQEAEIKRLLIPLIDALDTVHKVDLIHRDIKPDNIYLRRNGEPVLIDFGAARSTLGGRSQTLAAIVSHGYSPNEQYSDLANQGPWTDMYSLAAVVYRLITGKAPPDAPTRVDSRISDRPDPCIKLSQSNLTGYSPQFLAGIDKALELSQADRPQNVDEWHAQLGIVPSPEGYSTSNHQLSKDGHAETTEFYVSAKGQSGDHSPLLPKSRNWLLPVIATLGILALIGSGAYWWLLQQQTDLIGDTLAEAFELGTLGPQPQTVSEYVGGTDPGDFISFRLDDTKTVSIIQIKSASGMSFKLYDARGKSLKFLSQENRLLVELLPGAYTLSVHSPQRTQYQLDLSANTIDASNRPGNNRETALALTDLKSSSKDTYSHSDHIWPYQKSHYFHLNLQKPHSVTIKTTTQDQVLGLFLNNDNGTAIHSKKISASDDQPLVVNLAAGRYYISLNSRQRILTSYKLDIKLDQQVYGLASGSKTRVIKGNSFETASPLGKLSPTVKEISAVLVKNRLEHYYHFKTANAGKTILTATGNAPLSLELFENKERKRLATTQEANGANRIEKHLAPGTYTVRLSTNNPQLVKLSAKHIGAAKVGTSAQSPIKLGTVTERALYHKGILSKKEKRNFLEFNLNQQQQIIFQLQGNEVTSTTPGKITLNDLKRERSQTFEVAKGAVLNKRMALEQGSYQLEISNKQPLEQQAYSLEIYAVDKLPQDEAGDSAITSKKIVLSKTRKKTITGFVGGKDKSDWYRLETAEPANLSISLSGLSENADLLLRNKDGSIIDASRLAKTNQESLNWRTDGNPYFVEVRGEKDWMTSYLLNLQASPLNSSPVGKPANKMTGIWKSSARATLSDNLAKQEAVTAAKTLARARLVNEALHSKTKLKTNISSTAESAKLLKAMEKAITLDEVWDIKWVGDQELKVGLQARFHAINQEQILTASLKKSHFATSENITLQAGVTKSAYLGLFAWQADGTILRILPKSNSDQIALADNKKINLPRPGDASFISAPLPGKNKSHEALIAVSCNTNIDYTRLAPYITDSIISSLAKAVKNRVFVERFANDCKSGLSLKVLPYVVTNDPSKR
jgi:serine/threonine protein kinase